MKLYGDFSSSVIRAFDEIDPNWRSYPGIVLCGTHTPPKEVDNLLDIIRTARERMVPIYGECFGYQLCAIEFARNVLGIVDATSEEFGQGTFVVKRRPELKVGLHEGESWWSYYEAETYSFPENYFVSPAHPCYQSYEGKPHTLIKEFLSYARNH